MSLALFLLLTFVSAVLSAESPARIVGGTPVSIYDYPFAVALVHINPATGEVEQKCVGSVISSWHVLTAAHCFDNHNIENFRIRVGSTSSLEGGRLFETYYLVIHPDYYESPRYADLAVVMLYDFIPIADSVGAVFIPPQDTFIPDGYTVRAVGWGYGSEDGPKLDTLQAFDTNTISQQQCADAFAGDGNITIYDHVICTQAPKRSLCRGHSGAPIVIGQVLMGLSTYSTTCDDSTPDVYTRIDRHTEWILQEALPPYDKSGTPVRVAGF